MNLKIEFDAFQSMTSVTPFSTRLMTFEKHIRNVFEEHSVPELNIILYRKMTIIPLYRERKMTKIPDRRNA